jgi:phage terminase large subunit-like protein
MFGELADEGTSLERRMRAGTAIWHQCDGAGVWPAHRQIHRAGFYTEGHLVLTFIRNYCVFPEGPKAGQPAELMPFWDEIILQLYMLRDDGLRIYRRALIGVPKKNNKTTMLGWLSAYHTVADTEPSPVNVCAAAGDDQADLVFEALKATCEGGDGAKLGADPFNLKAKTERFEREVQSKDNGGRCRRLASAGGNLDGPNLYFRALDEIHEWRTAKNIQTYTVLSQGGALRAQPLLVMITTAGWDRQSLAWRIYQHGQRVAEKPSLDPAFFFVWYESPELAAGEWAGKGPYEKKKSERLDYRSKEAWYGANPAAGYTVDYERYLEDLGDPEMTEAVARRYRLNQWTETQESWLPSPWDSYRASRPYAIRAQSERRRVVVIDGSRRYDSTAVLWAEGRKDEDGLMHVRVKLRAWERPIDPRTGSPQEDWSIPYDEVRGHLQALHFGTRGRETWSKDGACVCCEQVFEPLQEEAIGFDPAYLSQFADDLKGEGLPFVEIPQSDVRMVKGFNQLFELLKDGRFEHDGDQVLSRHVANSTARWARSGAGQRLDRPTGTDRREIDAAITLEMAAYLLSLPPPERNQGPQIFLGGDEDEGEEDA